jgi:transcriptional regulator with PAS, ATPase and Fis domain
MKTPYAIPSTDDKHILCEKFMSKTLKKKPSNTRQDQYALIKKQSNAMQKLQRNEGKLHIFSSQLTRLIDAIPDAVLLKDREGRKLFTNQLTKSLFKLHDIDWYGKTERSLCAPRAMRRP